MHSATVSLGCFLRSCSSTGSKQAVVNPENTFYSVKRFVGRQPGEVKEELKEVSYQVDFEGQKVKIDCPVLSKKFAPEEISAQVLRKLSGDAGTYLSATVQKAGCFRVVKLLGYLQVQPCPSPGAVLWPRHRPS